MLLGSNIREKKNSVTKYLLSKSTPKIHNDMHKIKLHNIFISAIDQHYIWPIELILTYLFRYILYYRNFRFSHCII